MPELSLDCHRDKGFQASTNDVFRVYALDLLLLPVNLAGVLKSLEQAVSGRKIPLGRTHYKLFSRDLLPMQSS